MNEELWNEFLMHLQDSISDPEWRHPDPLIHCLIEAASYGLLGFLVARTKPEKPAVGHEAFTPAGTKDD